MSAVNGLVYRDFHPKEDDDDCMICFEKNSDGLIGHFDPEAPMKDVHPVHEACLRIWVSQSPGAAPTCPTCRGGINPSYFWKEHLVSQIHRSYKVIVETITIVFFIVICGGIGTAVATFTILEFEGLLLVAKKVSQGAAIVLGALAVLAPSWGYIELHSEFTQWRDSAFHVNPDLEFIVEIALLMLKCNILSSLLLQIDLYAGTLAGIGAVYPMNYLLDCYTETDPAPIAP